MMTLAPDDTILIIGAGIGGLALARALTLAGLKCQLFERAAELSAAGAGIMIQTAGMLALREIGLDVAVAAAGEELTIGRNATERGQTLMRSSLSFLKDQFGVPVVALHRSRLQAVLRQSAPSVPLHLDRALAGFTSDATGVTATFTDGTSARGAVLVGADGLRSAVRRQVLGDQPLRYAGYTTWRGIARHDDPTVRHTVTELWGPGARFGFTNIGAGEIYWFAVVDAPPGGKDERPLDAVYQHFANFAAPVPALLEATPAASVLRTDIHDREPVRTWSSDRVTLLGDAAHPTTPNLGHGGGMAIEDAVVLARSLKDADSVADAFAAYERARVSRTAAVVNVSRRFGQIGQFRNPVAIWLRNLMIRMTPERITKGQLMKQAAFSLPGKAPP